MERGVALYEAAVRLQEEHAQHARELGYEEMARRAEDRAKRAEDRERRAKDRAKRIRQNGGSASAGTLPGT
jgi:hypothetical protein